MAIYLILTYYIIHIFLMLISYFFLFIVILVNKIVLSIANFPNSIVFYIFLINVNRNLISLLFLMLQLC